VDSPLPVPRQPSPKPARVRSIPEPKSGSRRLQNYGANAWAGLKTYLDAVTDRAAGLVIDKYAGRLAAADVYTHSTTLWVLESIRLDQGYASQIRP
jgi:hypothetical protein